MTPRNPTRDQVSAPTRRNSRPPFRHPAFRRNRRILASTLATAGLAAALFAPGPATTEAAYLDETHSVSEGIGVDVPLMPVVARTVPMPGAQRAAFDFYGRLWVTIDNQRLRVMDSDLTTELFNFNTGSLGQLAPAVGTSSIVGTQPATMNVAQCSIVAAQLSVRIVTIPLGGTPLAPTSSSYTGHCDVKLVNIGDYVYAIWTADFGVRAVTSARVKTSLWSEAQLTPRTETRPGWRLQDIAGANERAFHLFTNGSDSEIYLVTANGLNRAEELLLELPGVRAESIDVASGEARLSVWDDGAKRLRVYEPFRGSTPKEPVVDTVLSAAPAGRLATIGGIFFLVPLGEGDPTTGDGLVKVYDGDWAEQEDIRIPGLFYINDVADSSNTGITSALLTGSPDGDPDNASLVELDLG